MAERCAFTNPDTAERCDRPADVLWGQETYRVGTPMYLCMNHARKLFPALFPPPPKQMHTKIPKVSS